MHLNLRFKSIKTKLMLLFGGLTLIICSGISFFCYLRSTDAMKSLVDESLLQMARESAKVVQSRVENQLDILEALASTEILIDDSTSLDEKLAFLQNEVETNDYLRLGITDLEGNARYTDGSTADLRDREYVKKALAGERAVSDPLVSKIDGSLVLMYAVPIKDGNVIKGVLLGARDGNSLSDIVSDISYGLEGYAFIINQEGTTIAHPNKDNVVNMDNIFENAKSDPGLAEFAQLQQYMIEGQEGTGQYTYQGVTKYMGYAPVPDTTWSIGITAPKTEVMERIDAMAEVVFYICCLFLVGGLIIVFLFATSISKPLRGIAQFLSVVATGDLTGEVPAKLLKQEDEIGLLAKTLNTTQHSIRDMIGVVSEKSIEMEQVLASINDKMSLLNKDIEEISAVTEEVSAGTEETASSTEEISATSEQLEKAARDIAARAQESSATANNISQMAAEMKENAVASVQNASEIYGRVKKDLENALEKSKSVEKINELSESILEITSQTNLLALNAAIEAARAGEAGRGFAVVAEEIRKLAEGSNNAVETIKEVTAEVLEAVESLAAGSNEIMKFIDQRVVKDYNNLVKTGEDYSQSSVTIKDMISDFSATSEELLASIDNLVKALDEISRASSEGAEGTAHIAQGSAHILQIASEISELTGSAKRNSELLKDSVTQFKV